VVLSWIEWLFMFCGLFFFIVGSFVVLGPVLILPLPLTTFHDRHCHGFWCFVLILGDILLGIVLSLLLLLEMCGLCNWVFVVEWELIAYMLLCIWSSVQCLVYMWGLLPSVWYTLGICGWGHYHLLIKICITFLRWWLIRHWAMYLCWHHCRCCIIRSGFMLFVYCVIWPKNFPLVALLVPCVCWFERWLHRQRVDDNLFFLEVVYVSILINKTVHRSSFSFFTLCFMSAAKLTESSFLHFKFQNLFYSKHHR
jgi:hypothetical protein